MTTEHYSSEVMTRSNDPGDEFKSLGTCKHAFGSNCYTLPCNSWTVRCLSTNRLLTAIDVRWRLHYSIIPFNIFIRSSSWLDPQSSHAKVTFQRHVLTAPQYSTSHIQQVVISFKILRQECLNSNPSSPPCPNGSSTPSPPAPAQPSTASSPN
jgi:hypothetical protein